MRLLHTSDWHLGHSLHDVSREYEHHRFLEWLLEAVDEHEIDALLISGDVFETANPPASAQAMWYRFLARLRRRFPELDVVVIGGNHDSAARLDAPEPLLAGLGIHVVGGLPRRVGGTFSGSIDVDRVVVPLRVGGEIRAWVAAVPFLRVADLPGLATSDASDPLIDGVRAVYDEVLAAARERREPGQALVAMGHLYMVGTAISRLSERRILGGNQHALPVGIFPDDVAYAALGHLHKPQRVGGREGVRYSGSPIPLAMSEARYRHQVCVVELDGEELTGVEAIEVPRVVPLMRIPKGGAAEIDEVIATLSALPDWDGEAPERRPFLEVHVALPSPEPQLRQQVEAALEGKAPRLLKLGVEYCGDGAALGDSIVEHDLKDLEPVEVFVRRYQREHEGDPEPELLEVFHELLEQVRQEGTA
jgi:exonuclease SbcD